MKKVLSLLVVVAASLLAGCGPLDPQSLVHAGAEALARGGTTNLVRAVYLLEQAARDLPHDARCQNLHGLALYEFGDTKKAAEAFQRAVAADRNNPAFRYNLGLAAYAQRDLASALEQFQSCTALDPRNVSAWLFLGATFLDLNRLDEAFRATRNAYDLGKTSAEALSNLAVISCRRKRPRDAETWLNEALRIAPNNPHVVLNMARLYELELKDKRRALEFYRRYSALAPESPFRFAVLRSTRQLELDLNLPPSPLPTPAAAAATNAPPAAAAPIIVNTNTATLTVTMTSELQPAALDALIAQLKIAGRNRDAAEVALSLADHYQQRHDTNRASAAYAQAAELDPLNALTHFRLGELFLQQNQKAPALQSLQEAVRLKPDFLAALRRAAPLAAEIGLPDVAVNAYKRIVELDPADAGALFHLGDLQDRYLKNRAVAEQTYQTFLKKFPTAPDAATVRSRLGRASAASREAAKPAAKPAPKPVARAEEPPPLKLPLPAAPAAPVAPVAPPPPPPDRRTPQERYQDALALLQRGAYAEAEPQFEALLRVDPTFAKAHLALGQIYSQRPETKTKARQHYIRFLQMRPDDPKAQEVRRWLNETRWMP